MCYICVMYVLSPTSLIWFPLGFVWIGIRNAEVNLRKTGFSGEITLTASLKLF